MKKTGSIIPKKIHYCWFGKKTLPKSVEKCIKSWEKYCPDYEIIQWNESNIDLNHSKFAKDAYEAGKWAFVSDALRYQIIYDNGGIYFDTDVEVIKNLDTLLSLEAFMGFEGSDYIASGLGFGGVKGCKIIKEMADIYSGIDFLDNINSVEKISTPILITSFLEKRGLVRNGELQKVGDLTIFPEDYFSPKNPITRLLNITNNTYSIHHYDASWVDSEEKKHIEDLEIRAKELMKEQSKKVSIIIPVYNGANYVRRAIDSALNQTYKNIEVIVVNDGSTDKTDDIVRSYGNRVRYYKKENGGVATALNLGIQKMRGQYFSWLSHDDEYHPEKIEKQVKLAKKYDDNTIIVSNWLIIDQYNNILEKKYISHIIEKYPTAFLAFDRKTWLNFCALLIPKSIFEEYGNFDETLKTTQDYDFLFRISQKSKFKILEDHLLFSRAHPEQGCLSIKNALDDSDIIHYNIISSLSHKEIMEYFNNNIDDMYEVFYSFYNNGYKRAPSIILKHILQFYKDNGNSSMIIQDICEKVLGINDSKINSLEDLINKYNEKKAKPRLLFFSADWLVGGVERVLSVLFNNLSQDYDIILITPYTDKVGLKLNNNIHHFKVSHAYFESCYDFCLFAFSIIYDVDITIGCMNLFEKVLDFYQLLRGTKIRAISSNHEHYLFPYKSKYLNKAVQKRLTAYKNVCASIWLTNFSTKVYNCYNDNGYKIANPNTFEVQNNNIEKKKEKIILCVGRFYDFVKRVDRTLKCFSIVLKSVPDAKLVMVGKYDLNVSVVENEVTTINDLMAKYKLPKEKVEFVGEQENVADFYKAASLLILTSNTEGFPMVFNEAGAYGLPVVCNEIPGLEDIIIDSENGFIVPQDDLVGMAQKVVELLNNNDLRVKMGEKSKELVSRFTVEKICEQWKFVFDEVIKSNDNIKLQEKLNTKLNCEIANYAKSFKDLANELNNIFIYVNQSSDLPVQNVVNNQNRINRYFKLFVRSLKDDGLKSTLKKSIRKIKNKIIKK